MAKKLTIKTIKEYAGNAEIQFKPEKMELITAILKENIIEQDLAELNEHLLSYKRRQVTLEDIARVAYVHIRSIVENDGSSPYARIKIYCSKVGYEYDNWHIAFITAILVNIEMITVVNSKYEKGKCKVYHIPFEIETRLKLPKKKGCHT